MPQLKSYNKESIAEYDNNKFSPGMSANVNDPLVHIPFRRRNDATRLSGSQTFTNASTLGTRTYVDPLDGLVKFAAPNEPRFEKMRDGGTGILIEGTSTNLVQVSDNFLGVGWEGFGATHALSLTELSPNGIDNARVLAFNGTANAQTYVNTPTVVGTTYTMSMWVKSDGTAQLPQQLYSSGELLSFTPTNEWVRVQAQYTATATSTAFLFGLNSGASSFLAWGAQLEALHFASSYIPTTTGAVTRLADNLTIPVSGNRPDVLGRSFVVDFSVLGLNTYNSILDVGTTASTRWVTHTLQYGSIQNYDDNSLYTAANLVSPNTVYRLALSSAKKTYIDGKLVASSPPNPNTSNTLLGYVYIGSFTTQDYHLFGHVRNFRIYDRALTDAEVSIA